MAVRFINEASGNALRFLTLQGANASAASGTVVFGTTTGANGNDNNTLDTCDLGDGASTPANAIYSAGSTGTTARFNNGNSISNCNVFNFYSNAVADVAGVRLEGGNSDWTITGNSFYQTASRAAVGTIDTQANVRAIYVNNAGSPSVPPGTNFTITGNFIGGDSPGAAVATQKWTTTGTTMSYLFQGIRLHVGTATASSVQGNIIRNIVWTTDSSVTIQPIWSGIDVQAGNVNIGTIAGNAIGSGTGTGSIAITTAGQHGTACGIFSASDGTVAITNNTIGSITASGADTQSASLTGIVATAGANTISSNTVGSTDTANSLNAATSSNNNYFHDGQQVSGILSNSFTSASITGNTVANLNNNTVGFDSSAQIRGIATSAGMNIISGNTVRNLSTTNQNAFSGNLSSVVGISQYSAAGGQTVSGNIVHSLTNTAISAGVRVFGIYYAGNLTTGPNLIQNNLVHSLDIASTSGLSELDGMYFAAGTFTARNNVVSVGINADGNSAAGAGTVYGIVDNQTAAGRNFYHNSVHVGGTQTSGGFGSYAFNSSGMNDFRNNIFANSRGNGGASSKHYAVRYGGTAANPSGLTADNNFFSSAVRVACSADTTTPTAQPSPRGRLRPGRIFPVQWPTLSLSTPRAMPPPWICTCKRVIPPRAAG